MGAVVSERGEGVVPEEGRVGKKARVGLEHPADRYLVASLYPGELLRRVFCSATFDDQRTVADSVGSVVRGQSAYKGEEAVALLPLRLVFRQLARPEHREFNRAGTVYVPPPPTSS